MHVSLSDLLICPRCGPEWGLVLVPGEVRARRVETGWLGCPNCRGRYEIRGGVGWLGSAGGEAGGEAAESEAVVVPTAVAGGGGGGGSGVEGAVRVAALLGLAERRGAVLVMGPGGVVGEALARLVEGVEVVVSPPPPADRGAAGVSVLAVGDRIPVRTGALSGVVLTGRATRLVEEGARVLGPGARLLLDPAPGGALVRLKGAGLRVMLEEGETVVAVR